MPLLQHSVDEHYALFRDVIKGLIDASLFHLALVFCDAVRNSTPSAPAPWQLRLCLSVLAGRCAPIVEQRHATQNIDNTPNLKPLPPSFHPFT